MNGMRYSREIPLRIFSWMTILKINTMQSRNLERYLEYSRSWQSSSHAWAYSDSRHI